ncbi:MAG: GH92 family glycosyl hydrolase [Bacteroidota bacterium]
MAIIVRTTTVILLLCFSFKSYSQHTSPVDFVNVLTGTQSKFSFSTGNTYPAITLPYAMNCWVPQTGEMGNGWVYTYDAEKIMGLKETHQPSPWINDYGNVSLMPITGKVRIREKDRASSFSHKAEVAKPYYYSVYLADYNVTAEVAPTEHAASMRFTFPESDSSYVVIDAFDKGSFIKVIHAKNEIIGYSTRNSGGVPENFRNYFIIKFDKPFLSASVWHDGKETVKIEKGISEYKEKHVGALIRFRTKKGEKINLSVASSFISAEQAELNLAEVGTKKLEVIKEEGRTTWNKSLSKIEVEGGSIDQLRTFYSCLYRTMLFPRKLYEINKEGQPVHYSPYNGQVLPGYMFTDNGFWDTFRAAAPLINLIEPTMSAQIQEGLVNAYKESGWLPEWASPGHRDCMIGSNSASIITDAYMKGIKSPDIQVLYEAMLKNTEAEGPVSSVGRKGAADYNKHGYVPYDVKINENVARTLEYAYADWTIWQLAKALGRPQEEIDKFAKRCQNYRNVFDPETKLMRGKNRDGSFQAPFNPFKWGDAFTEGNSWHYTWSVFHDVEGLIDLMGGRKEFVTMLDSVFNLPPVYDDSYYGQVIHEIREMQTMNMGNYAHGNQPIQHMIYLYNYAGEPWKSQYWLREVMNRLYSPNADGYCGDEDNGQTSAWYIFTALGFYPLCPGTDQYVIGAPLFNKATIHLENGKQVIINAPANSETHRYVKSINVDGKPYSPVFFTHEQLLGGAVIDFEMSDAPDKTRGTNIADVPYSVSKK